MSTESSLIRPHLVEIGGTAPAVSEDAWVAPGAVLAGHVTLAAEVSVWYSTVVRADMDVITVGEGTNIQDGCVVHVDPGVPASIGRNVSVGHRAVLHGCMIEDDSLIGMGAVVLNGAVVGQGCLVAAGAVILEGTEIPPGSLVAGVPAKVRRELTEDERLMIRGNAEHYRALARTHAEAIHG